MDYILIGIIILVAAFLRLWKLGQVPFMHDEFTTLLQTPFNNFNDYNQQGIKPEIHSIGVQMFLWLWVRIFGWSEFWIKLPFALMGIGSVYLIYFIGQQWFNRKIGLFSAAFFAVSQLTVFYSKLALPYSAGLFFVLLMTVFWHKVVFETKKPSLGIYFGFALSAWGCSVIQHFSIAQVSLIFLTGLFFLPKERLKAYWICGIAAMILFAPTLPIFYQQHFMSSSIGGRLATPKPTFLLDFIQYTMNYSQLFIFTVGIVILLPLILGKRSKLHQPLRWAGIVWFVIIFAIAFIYSLKCEPILHYGTLIFSYPFVIVVAFSLFGTRTLSPWQTSLVVAAILFVGTTSLIMERRHFDLMYHQGFDQIAVEMQQDKEQFGDKIHFATRTEIGEAAEFYQAKTNVENRIVFNRYSTLNDFHQWLNENDGTPMLGFGWTDYANPIWEVTAVGNYPYLVEKKDWFNSRYLTLSKTPIEGGQYMLQALSEDTCRFVEGQERGEVFTYPCDSLPKDVETFGVVAQFNNEVEVNHCVVVIEVHDTETDSLLLWHSSLPDDGHFLPGHHTAADAIVFSEDLSPEGKTIKAFLWNQDKKPLDLTKLNYYFTKKSRVLTGLYEPLN